MTTYLTKQQFKAVCFKGKSATQQTLIALMRFNTFFFTIFQVIIHHIMKCPGQFLYAFTFKIHKTVYAFYLSPKHIVLFAKRN